MPPKKKRSTSGRPYRRAQARVVRESGVCAICGDPIPRDAKWPAPLSPSAHHLEPVSHGGRELGPLVAAHLGCNRARGNRSPAPPEDRSASW